MNKFTLALIAFTLLLAIAPMEAEAASPPKIVIDGRTFTVSKGEPAPFINKDGRVMVPVRSFAEALGVPDDIDHVFWNASTLTATLKNDSHVVVVTVGQRHLLSNNLKVEMDTAAVIKQQRLFVPVRYIAEAFGAKVGWDAKTRTVIVTTSAFNPHHISTEGLNGIIMRMNEYPLTGRNDDLASANLELNRRVGDLNIIQRYVDLATDYITTEYTHDYQNIDEIYKRKILFYINNPMLFNGEMLDPEEYVQTKIEFVKKNRITVESVFVSDPVLVYEDDQLLKRVRGELRMKFASNDVLDESMHLHHWYGVDVEIVLGKLQPMESVTWETTEWQIKDVLFLNMPQLIAPEPDKE